MWTLVWGSAKLPSPAPALERDPNGSSAFVDVQVFSFAERGFAVPCKKEVLEIHSRNTRHPVPLVTGVFLDGHQT